MKTLTLLTTLALCNLAFAGNTTKQPQKDKILSSLTLDLDGDSYPDVAYLTLADNATQEELDLWIKLSSQDQYYKISALAENMLTGLSGLSNDLEVNSAGSLKVVSYNDSVGRSRWTETVTLAFRNKSLKLAGYTFTEADTVDSSYSSCDVNVLSLQGKFESQDGNVVFDVASRDRLTLDKVNRVNLQKTYLQDYCYSFDLGEFDDDERLIEEN